MDQLLSWNTLIYLIGNGLSTYVLYKFFDVFYAERRVTKKFQIGCFVAYFLVNSSLFLVFDNPYLNLVVNICGYYLLSLIYQTNTKSRIFASVLIYVVRVAIESVFFLVSSLFPALDLPFWEFFISQFFTYVAVILFKKYKNIRQRQELPVKSWFNLIMVPSVSLFIIFLMLYLNPNILVFLVVFVLLLGANISVFSLYDSLNLAFQEHMEKTVLSKQNQFYERQFHAMKESALKIRTLRHDFENHVSVLRLFAQVEANSAILNYLLDLEAAMVTETEYATSGNLEVDSILNFKIEQAKKRDIVTELTLKIPPRLPISSFDWVVILGNLLDNSIAALESASSKWLNIQIVYTSRLLTIKITNPYQGTLVWEEGKLKSLKSSKQHGLGLLSVNNSLQKYQGTLSIKLQEQIFCVTITIPTEVVEEASEDRATAATSQ